MRRQAHVLSFEYPNVSPFSLTRFPTHLLMPPSCCMALHCKAFLSFCAPSSAAFTTLRYIHLVSGFAVTAAKVHLKLVEFELHFWSINRLSCRCIPALCHSPGLRPASLWLGLKNSFLTAALLRFAVFSSQQFILVNNCVRLNKFPSSLALSKL